MTTMTLTALYDQRAEADMAAERLMQELDVPRGDLALTAQEVTTSGTTAAADGTAGGSGFFASLKELFMPEDDRHAYSEAIRRGGFVLTARVEEGSAERATAILEEHGAVDLDDRREAWRADGWTGDQGPLGAQALADGTVVATTSATTGGATTTAPVNAPPTATSVAATGEEESIALVEERLRVGKRAVEGGRVRVRSHVVETPVQEQVSLREETVSIERRAVDRPVGEADPDAFRERSFEATEIAEEAVVSKTARVVEEVVVSKAATDRVETVRDTVRRTEVEVDDDRKAGAATAARPAAPIVPSDPGSRR